MLNDFHLIASDESDYSSFGNPPTVLFSPGSRRETLLIQIFDDSIYEETQSFTLSILTTRDNKINFRAEDNTTVNIIDDEFLSVEFTNSSYIFLESDGKVAIGVKGILPPGGSEVLVNFMINITTVDGTATGIHIHVSKIHNWGGNGRFCCNVFSIKLSICILIILYVCVFHVLRML